MQRRLKGQIYGRLFEVIITLEGKIMLNLSQNVYYTIITQEVIAQTPVLYIKLQWDFTGGSIHDPGQCATLETGS